MSDRRCAGIFFLTALLTVAVPGLFPAPATALVILQDAHGEVRRQAAGPLSHFFESVPGGTVLRADSPPNLEGAFHVLIADLDASATVTSQGLTAIDLDAFTHVESQFLGGPAGAVFGSSATFFSFSFEVLTPTTFSLDGTFQKQGRAESDIDTLAPFNGFALGFALRSLPPVGSFGGAGAILEFQGTQTIDIDRLLPPGLYELAGFTNSETNNVPSGPGSGVSRMESTLQFHATFAPAVVSQAPGWLLVLVASAATWGVRRRRGVCRCL